MTLESLRHLLTAALAALAVTAAAGCAQDRGRRGDSQVALRSLGESTASPGSDHDRPVAQPVDTREVSATVTRPPQGPAPAAAPPAPAGQETQGTQGTQGTQEPMVPAPLPGQPAPQPPAEPPITPPHVPPPPPPDDTGSPGVFAPPPPPGS